MDRVDPECTKVAMSYTVHTYDLWISKISSKISGQRDLYTGHSVCVLLQY